MTSQKLYVVLALLLVSSAFADVYDYIIIGGGTAGCVIAERLSRDASTKVLVLNKGDDKSDLMSSAVALWNSPIVGVHPANVSLVASHNYYVNFHKSQETAMGFRSLDWGACDLLGGCATINGNAFGFPTEADLAGWDSDLWTFNATIEDRKSLENCVGDGVECNPAHHGVGGPITTNIFKPNSLLAAIANATKTVLDLSDNADVNGPVAEGVGYLPRNIEVVNGAPVRQDTYSKILKPVVASRPNLVVKSHAYARKINLKSNGKNNVVYDHHNVYITDIAKRRVILTAGSFGNTELLLHSGIGDSIALETMGIDVQVSNNQVGKNLMDSVLTSMIFTTPASATNNTPGAIVVAYYKSPGYVGNTTNMELAFASISPLGNTFLAQLTHLRHSAVGEVKLISKNPHHRPSVTFNLYANTAEALALVDQFVKTRQVFASLAEQGLPFIELRPGLGNVPANASAATILAYLASVVGAEGHSVGTCSLHKVVDEHLNLIDGVGNVIPGVSIADNSIVPHLLSTHATSGTAMFIGARAATLISAIDAKKRSTEDNWFDW